KKFPESRHCRSAVAASSSEHAFVIIESALANPSAVPLVFYISALQLSFLLLVLDDSDRIRLMKGFLCI
ncbi:hypothetical protein L195_g009478, partial [Trifolium pratense]